MWTRKASTRVFQEFSDREKWASRSLGQQLTAILVRLIALIVSAVLENSRLRWDVLRRRRVSRVLWLILPRHFGEGGRTWHRGRRAVAFVGIRRRVDVLYLRDVDARRTLVVRRRIKRSRVGISLDLLFPSKASRPPSQTSFVLKHVLGTRVDRPVMSLARLPALLRQLLEAFVQAQVMTNRVFPAVVVAVEEWISEENMKMIERLEAFADGICATFFKFF